MTATMLVSMENFYYLKKGVTLYRPATRCLDVERYTFFLKWTNDLDWFTLSRPNIVLLCELKAGFRQISKTITLAAGPQSRGGHQLAGYELHAWAIPHFQQVYFPGWRSHTKR